MRPLPSRQNKMVDVKELCDDGYRLAIQAVDLDKIGSGNAAAFFYIEAAEALIKALSYDPTLDVKDKASQYIRRAEELRAQEKGSISFLIVFLTVLMEWLYIILRCRLFHTIDNIATDQLFYIKLARIKVSNNYQIS